MLSPTASQCNDIAASIISEAEQCVQAESFKSTSDVLMLARCVTRKDSFAIASPIQHSSSFSINSTSKDCYLVRDNAGGHVKNGVSAPSLFIETSLSSAPLFIETSLSSSPRCSPPCSPTDYDDRIHLPGKFGAMSSAEVRMELTSSPVKRTEFLSKLDGVNRVIRVKDSSSSISMLSDDSVALSNGSMDSCDELINKVARSSSVTSAAMENAHAHANRIKLNLLKSQQRSRENSVENSLCFSSSLPVIDQSINGLSSPLDRMMPLWVKRKIDASFY